ncbi:hypothetical protein P280DRAFT_542367 [Massarina eburnea CBS 473.64]|uniref:Uncharacterized protein n=1 Tax=Massarina eburnea CBS 473.64 TaxID=1395130 RepID=A0A6A6S2A6_9PLEO|nr:hypothetical protein P280DRAFT_542367 [Massarina eburnea CBS 473.64]
MDKNWDEVERMAQAASAADALIAGEYPSADTIQRWKKLFGYSDMEATQLVSQQRADVTRERISDDHWAEVSAAKEALGYDREAYEHSLQLQKVFKDNSATITATSSGGETTLFFKLGGLLDSPEKVKELAGLEELPKVVVGMGTTGPVKFCLVNKKTQKRLQKWLVQQTVLHR